MAFDTYVAFSADIKGESPVIANSIQISSFSWGATSPITVGEGSAGLSASKVSLSRFSFDKKTDAASASMFLACCNGKPIPTATVHMRKQTGTGGQADFLTITLTNVMIASFQQNGRSGGDDTPTESVSVAYQKINIVYKKTGADNKLTAGGEATWDITKLLTK